MAILSAFIVQLGKLYFILFTGERLSSCAGIYIWESMSCRTMSILSKVFMVFHICPVSPTVFPNSDHTINHTFIYCLPCVWCPMLQFGEKTCLQKQCHLCETLCNDHPLACDVDTCNVCTANSHSSFSEFSPVHIVR